MKEFAESRLALGAGELWDLGTRAKFLNAVGDGSLPEDAFDRWLVQDYLFVRGFVGFASLTVGKTPRPGQSVLIAGLSALDDEHPHPRQQAMFNEVMRHERDFWRMTWKG